MKKICIIPKELDYYYKVLLLLFSIKFSPCNTCVA